MAEVRLDTALAARGIARSRTVAARMIADGVVRIDGAQALKASALVSDEQTVTVDIEEHYVSRAAYKMLGALDEFEVDPTGQLALDVGASTGGFTQVLLERGADHVIALDVGHGQLVPELRADRRVTVIEGVNARGLNPTNFAELTASAAVPTLVVADLSFISLSHVLPALRSVAAPDADFVLLIKPQFEVGKQSIREGVVRDAGLRSAAIADVLWAAWDTGLGTAGLTRSPIVGGSGNQEYLVWLSSTRGVNPTEWEPRVPSIAGLTKAGA